MKLRLIGDYGKYSTVYSNLRICTNKTGHHHSVSSAVNPELRVNGLFLHAI